MKIKVCGMRDGGNILGVAALGVAWIGLVFNNGSPRNVTMIPTHAGIIPDRGKEMLAPADAGGSRGQGGRPVPGLVGVFADEMAQNIVTRVVNFRLDAIQLEGHEPPTLIRNLRSTLTGPSDRGRAIAPGLQVWKTLRVADASDLSQCEAYADCCDMFVFDVGTHAGGLASACSMLAAYDGTLPFLLSGDIGPADAAVLRNFSHPRCEGVSIGDRFETAPAMKDVEEIGKFVKMLDAEL